MVGSKRQDKFAQKAAIESEIEEPDTPEIEGTAQSEADTALETQLKAKPKSKAKAAVKKEVNSGGNNEG
jgi:hypothetical protein